ncbi:MAG: DUF4160 domain-containing protein [Acidobacteriota bacterium]
MPVISRFFGIVISMYYNDHVPPHFHIAYAHNKAQMAIETLAIIEGELPRRAINLTMEWAALHRDELRTN